MKILYIIGNGFDLHHRINTRYTDFQAYLEKIAMWGSQRYVYHDLQRYFRGGDLWYNFEESLGKFDINYFIENNLYLAHYGSDSEHGTHLADYSNEFKFFLTVGIKNELARWIMGIKKPENIFEYLLNLDKEAFFLTFNYTDTLENIYNISPSNILHIHNMIKNEKIIKNGIQDGVYNFKEPETDIIIGHPHITYNDKIKTDYSDKFTNVINSLVESASKTLMPYYEESEKNTGMIIKNNNAFFNDRLISKFERIIIIGHSLSDVDIVYFHEIEKFTNNNIKYLITYFGKNERNRIGNQAKKFLINRYVKFKNMENWMPCTLTSEVM